MIALVERLARIRVAGQPPVVPEPPATPVPCATYADALAVLADIPAAVREVRAARGLSLWQAGQELGVNTSTVNGWELGLRQPEAAALAVILRWVAGGRPGGVATCPRGRHEWILQATGQRSDGRRYCLACEAEREAERARVCRNGHVRVVEYRDRRGRRWCPDCKKVEAERRRAAR